MDGGIEDGVLIHELISLRDRLREEGRSRTGRTPNAEFLRAEIMDVLRLFGEEERNFGHTFLREGENFINVITCGGVSRTYSDIWQAEGELEFRRCAKRSANRISTILRFCTRQASVTEQRCRRTCSGPSTRTPAWKPHGLIWKRSADSPDGNSGNR